MRHFRSPGRILSCALLLQVLCRGSRISEWHSSRQSLVTRRSLWGEGMKYRHREHSGIRILEVHSKESSTMPAPLLEDYGITVENVAA